MGYCPVALEGEGSNSVTDLTSIFMHGGHLFLSQGKLGTSTKSSGKVRSAVNTNNDLFAFFTFRWVLCTFCLYYFENIIQTRTVLMDVTWSSAYQDTCISKNDINFVKWRRVTGVLHTRTTEDLLLLPFQFQRVLFQTVGPVRRILQPLLRM